MENYLQSHQLSIQHPEIFWAEQAKRIHWEKPFSQVLDYSAPPFAKWFVDGKTSICYNSLDRHLQDRAAQTALIAISVETNTEQTYSYQELYIEVNRMAAILKSYGVGKGDRVLIYMPMVAQACFAMLAVLRLGAIHSVVFGGFASHSLAARIEDAEPKFIITAEAGMRAGKVVPYKPLLDEAIEISTYKPEHVLIASRGLCDFAFVAGRDLDYSVDHRLPIERKAEA